MKRLAYIGQGRKVKKSYAKKHPTTTVIETIKRSHDAEKNKSIPLVFRSLGIVKM